MIFESESEPELQTVFMKILNPHLWIFYYHLHFFIPLLISIRFYFYCPLLELFHLLSYLKVHRLLHFLFLFHPFSFFSPFLSLINFFYPFFSSCSPYHLPSFFSFFMILICHFYFLRIYLLNLHFFPLLINCFQEWSFQICFYYFLPINHLLLLPFAYFNSNF